MSHVPAYPMEGCCSPADGFDARCSEHATPEQNLATLRGWGFTPEQIVAWFARRGEPVPALDFRNEPRLVYVPGRERFPWRAAIEVWAACIAAGVIAALAITAVSR